MPPKIARLLGLGAFGAIAGMLALFALLVFITMPTRTGGLNTSTAAVAWIAFVGIFAALIIVHIGIGRQLLVLARGPEAKHPL